MPNRDGTGPEGRGARTGEVVEIVQILQYHQEEVQEEDLENKTF